MSDLRPGTTMYRIAALERRALAAEHLAERLRADLDAVRHDLNRALKALALLSSQPGGGT